MTRCLLPDQATAAFEQWPDASVYNLDINGQYAPPSLRQARQRVSHCVFCRTILHHAMHRSLVRARSAPLTRHTVLMLRLCWQPGISRLLLVKHAADPNKRDEAGCTPLIFAAYAGFAKGVEMLLKKGAECDARDRLGHTALHSVASALDQVKKRWTKPAEDGSSPGYFTMYGHCLSAAITLGHRPFYRCLFFIFSVSVIREAGRKDMVLEINNGREKSRCHLPVRSVHQVPAHERLRPGGRAAHEDCEAADRKVRAESSGRKQLRRERCRPGTHVRLRGVGCALRGARARSWAF